MTTDGGVVCFSPFKLSEAIVAANRGDGRWLRELGCVHTRAGVKGVLITPNAAPAEPWQVRLMPEGGQAATVWGYAPSFQTRSGRKFWPP